MLRHVNSIERTRHGKLVTEEGWMASDAYKLCRTCRPTHASQQRGLESCSNFSLLMQSRLNSPFLRRRLNLVWIEIQKLIH
jgi:hypothetical protein